jgi:tetratricopeptide (TPR) repeat protein
LDARGDQKLSGQDAPQAFYRPRIERKLTLSIIFLDMTQKFNCSADYVDRRSKPLILMPNEGTSPRFLRLCDMRLDCVHQDQRFLCRTARPAYAIVAAHARSEDLNGEILNVAMYNWQSRFRDSPESWLPVGTIILIKDPWYKLGAIDGRPTVRVESMSTVTFVKPSDEAILKGTRWFKPEKIANSSFDSLKEKGNEAFRKSDYQTALEFYDKALVKIPDSPVILLNKSACFWKLKRYLEGYEMALRAKDQHSDMALQMDNHLFESMISTHLLS